MKRATTLENGGIAIHQKSISSFFKPAVARTQHEADDTNPSAAKKRVRTGAHIDLTSEDDDVPDAKRAALSDAAATSVQGSSGKRIVPGDLQSFSQPHRESLDAAAQASTARKAAVLVAAPLQPRTVVAGPPASRTGGVAEKHSLREKAQHKLAQVTKPNSETAPAQPFTPLENQVKELKLKHPGILLLVEVSSMPLHKMNFLLRHNELNLLNYSISSVGDPFTILCNRLATKCVFLGTMLKSPARCATSAAGRTATT